ncbi:unnamed protein product [Phytophthora fragariaefolia]|uniref:Unnamed protein product n=1 Tax=Phytophthora fragariaefolia TaxID=1490495 RepID=A0A9W6X8P2_9STRA|nr:unnamed protein product [Phytophthora fragariaefolia]
MTSSSRRNEARLEKPPRNSPEGETALAVVMSGVQRPQETDIDGIATTDTDADMTVEWTTRVTRPDSSSEYVEDRLTDEDRSGSDYADPYHSDEHDRHVAAANDAERRAEAVGTYGRSENRGRRGDFPNRSLDRNSRQQGLDRPPTSERSSIRKISQWSYRASLQQRFKLSRPPTETGLVPIGLPQLASPPVDADCVYAFVGESKWLKTQRRDEVKEVNTTEIEEERNGSFGGGESDERKTEESNSDGSEGLVSSVTQKTWQDYHPENVIKLLSGERLGW